MTHCFPHSFNYRPLWIPDTWPPETHLLAYGLTSVRKVILSFPLSFQNSSGLQTPTGSSSRIFPLSKGFLGGEQEGLLEREGVQSALAEHAPAPCYLPMQCATVSRQGGAKNKIQGSRQQGNWKLHGRKPSPYPTAFPRALSQNVTIALE